MTLAISNSIQSPEAFNSGLQTVTDGVLQTDTKTALDSLEQFQPADDPGGEIAPPASFPDPATGITTLALADPKFSALKTAVLNPDLNVNQELLGLRSKLDIPFSQLISTSVEGVAANATKSGEELLGDAVLNTQSSLDDLMKRASEIDPSTAEGQKELAQIQIQFAQLSRQLQALSQMLKDFQDLMKQIINNF